MFHTERQLKMQIQKYHVTCWISGPLNVSIDYNLFSVNTEPLLVPWWIVVLIIR